MDLKGQKIERQLMNGIMQFRSFPHLHKLVRSFTALALVLALPLSLMAGQARIGATVRVTTHDEAEKAVAAVTVELKRDGAVVAKTTTNEKGIAEFNNVAPGSYEVVVSKEGLETLNQTDVTVAASAPIEIAFTVVPKVNLSDTVNVQAGTDTQVEKGSSVANEFPRATVKE